MNAAHIHLLLNHFPILGALFAAGVLLAGVLFNDRKINQVGLVSLVLFAILTIPAFLTGEGAEEVLEELPGISNASIKDHEEIAELGKSARYLPETVKVTFADGSVRILNPDDWVDCGNVEG